MKRLLASALVAGLMAALAWLLWGWFTPARQVRVAVLAASDYNLLDAPPLDYARTTSELFAPLGESPHTDVADWPGMAEAAKLEALLGEQLASSGVGSADTLIVYLAAHGISAPGDDGEPAAWLLTSDYDSLSGQGRYPLADLLDHLARSPAKLKLLLLDAGSLEFDPALGMLVNEFPRLLEQEVRKRKDTGLWVLASHDLVERSHAVTSQGASAFGQFVAEGLRGAADSSGDGKREVDLDELYRYVREQVGGWVWFATGQSETQTPLLLQAGAGRRERAEPLVLTRYTAGEKKSEPAVAPAGAKAGGKQASTGRPPTKVAWLESKIHDPRSHNPLAWFQSDGHLLVQATPPVAEEKAIAEDEPAVEAKPAADAAAKADPEAAEEKASPPTDVPAGAPQTAAPAADKPAAKPKPPARLSEQQRAWQMRDQLQDRTVDDGWTPVDYAPHVWRQYVATLLARDRRWRSVPEGQDQRAGSDEAGLRRRLDELRGEFAAGTARESYEQHPEIVRAVRVRNDLFFRAPYLIEWCYRRGGPQEQLGSDLGELLSALAELSELLGEQAGEAAGSAAPGQPAGAGWLSLLVEATGRAAGLQGTIEAQWRADLEAALPPADDPRDQLERAAVLHRYQAILETPLAPAGQRQDLTRKLANAKLDLSSQSGELPLPDAVDRRRNWGRVHQRVELEWRLARLLKGDDRSEFDQQIERLLAEAAPDGRMDDEAVDRRCRAYREIGALFAELYRGLPDRIDESLRQADDGSRRAAENMLRLLDARMSAEVDRQLARAVLAGRAVNPLAEAPLPHLTEAGESLSLAGPSPSGSSAARSPIRLKADEPATFQWTLRSPQPMRGGASLVFQYDPQQIRISTAEGKVIAPGNELKVPASAAATEALLSLRVVAVGSSASAAELTATASAGRNTASSTTLFALPVPDLLELVVSGPAGSWDQAGQGDRRRLTLRPFPSGQTAYAIEVRSEAPRERKLRYRLLALPAGQGQREWPWNREWQPPRGSKLLLDTELVLPAGSALAALPFPPLDKPPEAGAAQPPPQAPAEEAERAEPPGIDVSSGMICALDEMVNGQARSRHWTWIEIAPRHPGEYLLEPRVVYDADQERIAIQISAKGDELLPPEGSVVTWDLTDPLLIGAKRKRTQGVLASGGARLELFADVAPARNRTVAIRLHLDGYPRAFMYDVRCTTAGDRPVRKAEGLRELRIAEPSDGAWFRDPEKVLVRLQADAPPSRLHGRGCTVRVGIAGDSQQHEFDADRLVDARLIKGESPGQFLLATTVRDLEVELDTRGYPNQVVRITAAMLGDGQTWAEDERTVRLDARPPELVLPRTGPPRVRQGAELRITLEAEDDVSGMEKVQVALAVDESGGLKEPIAAAPDERKAGTYMVTLPTKELALGRHTLLAQATDVAGFVSPIEELTFYVDKPPAGGSPDDQPKNNEIRGTVVYGERGVRGAKVSIVEGPKKASTTADSRGAFRFADLPPGVYKLEAEGIARNGTRKGEAEVTVESPPAKAAQVVIEAM